MTRPTVPPMRRRPTNPLLEPTVAPGDAGPTTVKSTTYLTQPQADALDEARSKLRRDGVRNVTSAQLVRAALDLALNRHPEEWLAIARGEQQA